jgi:hypothetical protein
MTTAERSPKARSPKTHSHAPDRLLRASGVLWFLAAAAGQWIFVYYVAALYAPLLARKGFPGLAETHLPHGYVPGDLAGNLAIAAHVMIAIIIIGGGPLQLIPQLRERVPWLHRYIGRLYMATAIITSLAGLYLVWTRGVLGGMAGHLAISLDALLIIGFACVALRFAIAREIDRHRRWAMRLFMVVSAVWFFRIGLMFWFMTTGGVGIDTETFSGPFISFWYFGQMALPLAVLEFYLRAQDAKASSPKIAAAIVVLFAAAATAAGVFAATVGIWLPRL